MASKFWLHRIVMEEPWLLGGEVEVHMVDDAVPNAEDISVPCPAITQAEMASKTAAMPGALLRDIAAAICSDKLGVPVTATRPPKP